MKEWGEREQKTLMRKWIERICEKRKLKEVTIFLSLETMSFMFESMLR